MIKQSITKHNHLIEASYRLTLTEMQIVLYGISLMNPIDQEFPWRYSIEVARFAEMFDRKHSEIYRDVKSAICDKFWHREFSIKEENGTIRLRRWLVGADYNDNKGTIEISFNPLIKKFLHQLKDNFTVYYIDQIAHFKSIYSIRVYELAAMHLKRSRKKQFKFTYIIDDLKSLLALNDKYGDIFDFRKRVLEKAIKEINENSDLFVRYELKKTGRKYTDIEFTAKKKVNNKSIRADSVVRIATKSQEKTKEQKQQASAMLNELKKAVKI